MEKEKLEWILVGGLIWLTFSIVFFWNEMTFLKALRYMLLLVISVIFFVYSYESGKMSMMKGDLRDYQKYHRNRILAISMIILTIGLALSLLVR